MARGREKATIDVIINNEQAKQKVAELSAELDKFKRLKREALASGNKELADAMGKEIQTISKELKQYKSNVVDVDNVLRNLNKVPLNQLEAAQRSLQKELKTLNQDSKEYATTQEKLTQVQKQLATASGHSAGMFGNAWAKVKSMIPFASIAGVFMAIKQGISMFKDFQYKISEVGAVSGATSIELKELKENAKELGATTEYTATQVADLQSNYARLGFTPAQITQITSATLDLATATGSDLATSADVAGSTLKAFGLDASQAHRVVDVMSESFNKSALRLDYFSESMKYVAPIAAKTGVSIEQTTAMLGILADRGIRGSQAGTALKRILTEMSISGKSAADALAELNAKGLTVSDAMDEVGKYAMTALSVLADNAPAVDALTVSLENSTGAAQRTAAMMRDNLQGDWDVFKSKVESVAIWLGDKLNPVLRGTAQLFTWLLTPLKVLLVSFAAYLITIKSATTFTAAYAAVKKMILDLNAKSIILTNAETASNTRMLLSLRSATATTQAYAAVKLLLAGNFRMAAAAAKMFFASIGPIGWISIGVAAVVGALAAFSKESDKASTASSQLSVELAREHSTYNDLKKAILESEIGSKSRAETISLINERYKDYLPNMITEKMTNEEIAATLTLVNEKMEDNIRLKIRSQELEKIQEAQMKVEIQAMQDLVNAYQESGNKSKEQVALAQSYFAEIFEKIKRTGIEAKDLDDIFVLCFGSMSRATQAFRTQQGSTMQVTSEEYSNLHNILLRVAFQSEKTALSVSNLNAVVGSVDATTGKYAKLSLQELEQSLAGVNKSLESGTMLSLEYKISLEHQREEIMKQIAARKQQVTTDSSYAAVLQRLKDDKASLESQRDKTAASDTKELARINALIVAKQKEIDVRENKKSSSPKATAWSMDKDENFMKAKIGLRKKLQDGDIATEDEYSRQLLALEIKSLDARIKLNADKGDEILKMKSELADKQYQQQKNEKARYEKLIAASFEGSDKSDADRQVVAENHAYEKRLKDLELFGKNREYLTAEELAALQNLERNHQSKLQNIYMDGVARQFETEKKALDRSVDELKISNNNKLLEADTFAKKKELLSQWLSEKELSQIQTDAAASKLIKTEFQREEETLARKHIEKLLVYYNAYMSELQTMYIQTGNLNQEEAVRLQTIIDDLNNKLAGLRGGATTEGEDKDNKVDVLGYSQDDWDKFFTNIENGEMSLKNWQQTLGLIGDAFGSISRIMASADKKELKAYEETATKKKKELDRQLASGLISQNKYNKDVQAIDEETDAKKQEIERKQAVREKAFAIFQAITSTAVGIAAALPNLILAGIVGAMGALQIAAIASTPLPGAETGGFLVEREQDGKQFNAEYSPQKRGFVHKPTVIRGENGSEYITGENGSEYIIPSPMLRNPAIANMVNVVESARRSRNFMNTRLFSPTLTGREYGGYADASTRGSLGVPVSQLSNDSALITRLTETILKLNTRLDKPLEANTHLTGKGGILEAQDNYNRLRKTL